jgi:hypothetical protein
MITTIIKTCERIKLTSKADIQIKNRKESKPLKDEILSFGATWMELEDIMLNEMRQEQKDKYCMFSFIRES